MRFVLRFLGGIALAIAVLFAVVDATRSVAASALVLTPLVESWASALPDSMAAFEGWVSARLGPSFWSGLARPLLSLPGWALFGVVGLLLAWLGRKPEPKLGWGRGGAAGLRRRRV